MGYFNFIGLSGLEKVSNSINCIGRSLEKLENTHLNKVLMGYSIISVGILTSSIACSFNNLQVIHIIKQNNYEILQLKEPDNLQIQEKIKYHKDMTLNYWYLFTVTFIGGVSFFTGFMIY